MINASRFSVGTDQNNTFVVNYGNEERKDPKLKINPEGIVTIPYQPFFHAIATSHINVSVGNEQQIVPDSIIENIGKHFDLETGMFKAPIEGLYSLKCHARLANTNEARTDAKIFLNAGRYKYEDGVRSNSDGGVRLRVSLEVIQAVFLKAAEIANCSVINNGWDSVTLIGSATTAKTGFAGYLIN